MGGIDLLKLFSERTRSHNADRRGIAYQEFLGSPQRPPQDPLIALIEKLRAENTALRPSRLGGWI